MADVYVNGQKVEPTKKIKGDEKYNINMSSMVSNAPKVKAEEEKK